MPSAAIRAAILAALLVAPAAGAAVAGEPKPWDERALAAHLDFAALVEEVATEGPEALIAEGERLFKAKFTTLDGAGRPGATQASLPTKRRRPAAQSFQRLGGPDANGCGSCHSDPQLGGSGPFTNNVFVSEGFSNADFDSLDPQFSNERGTTHLFGAGLIELLAREMTAELQGQRRAALAAAREGGQPVTAALGAKGVSFGKLVAAPDGIVDLSGVEGVDRDLVVRPFGQKGVVASLRLFTLEAMNAHHGMQAEERFGALWTGSADYDEDGVTGELTPGDIAAVVAFQASLTPPARRVPEDPGWQAAAARGERLFADWGCAACHRQSLPLETLVFEDPSPYDLAGTLRRGDVAAPLALDLGRLAWARGLPRDAEGRVLVPLFGDLKRHVIADAASPAYGNETLSQRQVERNEFMTAELWGLDATAPYGHRGDLTTIDAAIRAHGGEAKAAAEAYRAAGEADSSDLIAFLRTLTIETP